MRQILTATLLFLGICGMMCALVPAQCSAQTFDLDRDRPFDVSLSGNWRFHAGDDPSWSSPLLDDTRWPLIRADKSGTKQKSGNDNGVAWYRAQLLVPVNTRPLALSMPSIVGSFEVFADGQMVAAQGGLPPHPYATIGQPRVVLLPQLPGPAAHSLCLAVRLWTDSGHRPDRGGGPIDGIRVGSSGILQSSAQLAERAKAFDSVGKVFLALLETLAAVTALTLFAFRQEETEYFWFSVALLLSAAGKEVLVYSSFHEMRLVLFDTMVVIFFQASIAARYFFYSRLVNAKQNWAYWVALVSTPLAAVWTFCARWNHQSPAASRAVDLLASLPVAVWITTIVIHRAREGQPDGYLLAAPLLLRQLVYVGANAGYLGLAAGWIATMPHWFYAPVTWPFSMSLYDLPDALFLLAMLAILAYRFTRTRSEEERFSFELAGARSVQRFLIPDELPPIPGFIIESDYRPALEVGGDFFQVIPDPSDDSLLVLIGDVAGHGLEAGMLATLLVGAVRTAATFTHDPAVILSTLNSRLYGKGHATCLILRIEPGGATTLVNAGHLPPYLNGREQPMEGALPLGTIPINSFPVMHFQLDPGDQITLMSDGILEAMKPGGELFGFDRIAALLAHSSAASSLAAAAQEFGQEDDITVLTVARSATAHLSASFAEVPLPSLVPHWNACPETQIYPSPHLE